MPTKQVNVMKSMCTNEKGRIRIIKNETVSFDQDKDSSSTLLFTHANGNNRKITIKMEAKTSTTGI